MDKSDDDEDEDDDEDSDNDKKAKNKPESDTKQNVGEHKGPTTSNQQYLLSFTVSPEEIAKAFGSYGFKNISYFKNDNDFKKRVSLDFEGVVPSSITGSSITLTPSMELSSTPASPSFNNRGRGRGRGGRDRGRGGRDRGRGGRDRGGRDRGRQGNSRPHSPGGSAGKENEVYVGQLPASYTQDEIKSALGSYGSVVGVKLKTKQDGTPLNYCFVQFDDASSASKAVSAGSGKIGETTIKISSTK